MAEEDPFGEAAAPAAPATPVVDEFKFTREWNMQFRERCEAKDKEAMEKKKELLSAGAEELNKWKEERANKLKAKADMECANPWERVVKLVDMSAEVDRDMSRMKQVMIRMKSDAASM